MNDTLAVALPFAEQIARAVRPLARRYFRSGLHVSTKADASPVTQADREIEAALRRAIGERFPSHGVLGEEMGGDLHRPWTWVVDPIDGTKSFICGVPLFGTLIALLYEGHPQLGVIDMPMLDECWVGRPGLTTFNGEPVRSNTRTDLSGARLFATSPDQFNGTDADRFATLSQQVSLRRFGGDCYSYGLLACGHADLVVEAGLQTYDVMALVPVVEGGGGVITDWNGQALSESSDGRVLAAANGELHRQALQALNPSCDRN